MCQCCTKERPLFVGVFVYAIDFVSWGVFFNLRLTVCRSISDLKGRIATNGGMDSELFIRQLYFFLTRY